MWQCVVRALTDVSEEGIVSIFRIEKSASGNQRQQVAADFLQIWGSNLSRLILITDLGKKGIFLKIILYRVEPLLCDDH
jgi:hypothetical protein